MVVVATLYCLVVVVGQLDPIELTLTGQAILRHHHASESLDLSHPGAVVPGRVLRAGRLYHS